MVGAMANGESAVEFITADLAPGDSKSLELNRSELTVTRVQSNRDLLFSAAYERLWSEFGPQHEMESRQVIAQRLAWYPTMAIKESWLRYEMIFVQRHNQFAAVRDHTAVVTCERKTPQAVVHLSHVLLDAAWRRTGLAGWLRAWPIQTARTCLMAAGFSATSPITLVAEMEHPSAESPNRLIRLQAYEKAGFKKVDATAVKYFQPDFRSPAEIDASGGSRPLPFGLILRRVGREQEQIIRGEEVRTIVNSLYRMYGSGFREQDMAVVWRTLPQYPADDVAISLVPPTQ
jgi:hypothetical protein